MQTLGGTSNERRTRPGRERRAFGQRGARRVDELLDALGRAQRSPRGASPGRHVARVALAQASTRNREGKDRVGRARGVHVASSALRARTMRASRETWSRPAAASSAMSWAGENSRMVRTAPSTTGRSAPSASTFSRVSRSAESAPTVPGRLLASSVRCDRVDAPTREATREHRRGAVPDHEPAPRSTTRAQAIATASRRRCAARRWASAWASASCAPPARMTCEGRHRPRSRKVWQGGRVGRGHGPHRLRVVDVCYHASLSIVRLCPGARVAAAPGFFLSSPFESLAGPAALLALPFPLASSPLAPSTVVTLANISYNQLPATKGGKDGPSAPREAPRGPTTSQRHGPHDVGGAARRGGREPLGAWRVDEARGRAPDGHPARARGARGSRAPDPQARQGCEASLARLARRS